MLDTQRHSQQIETEATASPSPPRLLIEALLSPRHHKSRSRTRARARRGIIRGTSPTLRHLDQQPALSEPKAPRTVPAPVHLGHLVRRVRKERKLSQGELAEFAGVGRRFISELENGKLTLEFGLVLRVCAAMGIEITARKQ